MYRFISFFYKEGLKNTDFLFEDTKIQVHKYTVKHAFLADIIAFFPASPMLLLSRLVRQRNKG